MSGIESEFEPKDRVGKFERYDIPDEENLPEFDKLRKTVLVQREKDFYERIKTNPVPSEEEKNIDAYREEIEPQCRDAIFKMRKKGYRTYSSGFGRGNKQIVDGVFEGINTDVTKFLKSKGYFVYIVEPNPGYASSIAFRPKNADINEITNRWNELADLLPDLGHVSEPITPKTRFNDELEKFKPTVEEIIVAVEKDIPLEDFKPMKEACRDDIGTFLGAIYSYMTEIKGLTDDQAQDYLIDKGLL